MAPIISSKERRGHPNKVRPGAHLEPKEAETIRAGDEAGWAAIHAALVTAARRFASGERDLVALAKAGIAEACVEGFASLPDARRTRFTGSRIMAWQDALFVMNELDDWHFPDPILCVAWLVECGGPAMGRGPARADFCRDVDLYIAGTRTLYNLGEHSNGPGWPASHGWLPKECPYMEPC